jgi:tRNA (guanosine-2'-O-)-methyltransferase
MSSEAVSLYDLDLTQPVALVFGNEHKGVSDYAREKADGNFLIPQVGIVQSLNISVACAVSLYEALRQRQLAGMYASPQLQEDEYASRRNNWFSR